MIRTLALAAALLAVPAFARADPSDKTLERIRTKKTITIAYRSDALPFAFERDGKPAGYTIELCKRVVASLEQQLKAEPIAIKWVPATVQNRLDLVRTGKADMECGATTATLSRMEQVDFSSPVFVDVTGLLARKASGAGSLAALAGKKIAVVEGTTNQKALDGALKRSLVSATVVTVKSRDEGVAALEAGTVDAFAGDKVLLQGLAGKVQDRSAYELLGDDLGLEPYAIVLPRGADGLRLAVNRALSRIYSSEAIVEVFRQAFGPDTKPSGALLVMYGLGSYPE